MQCPKCGSNNCQVITETTTEGKDFSASKGCCGWLLAGPSIRNHSGSVIIVERNGKHKLEGPALDRFDEEMQKVLRLPSDAGAQLFYRYLSVPFMRKMYRDYGRTCAWHYSSLFLEGAGQNHIWNYTSCR